MTRGSWIQLGLGITLVVILIVTAVQLAGALGRVSVLREQIAELEDTVVVYRDAQDSVRERGDSLMAERDEEERQDSISIAAAHDSVVAAVSNTNDALAATRNTAANLPVVLAALDLAIQELEDEREAGREKDAVSASTVFALQQRVRTLDMQILDERVAADDVRQAIQARLDLALQTIEVQQRALAPSFFQKIFDMPEVALVGAAIGGGLVYLAVR